MWKPQITGDVLGRSSVSLNRRPLIEHKQRIPKELSRRDFYGCNHGVLVNEAL